LPAELHDELVLRNLEQWRFFLTRCCGGSRHYSLGHFAESGGWSGTRASSWGDVVRVWQGKITVDRRIVSQDDETDTEFVERKFLGRQSRTERQFD
jgi:hypothetical protein